MRIDTALTRLKYLRKIAAEDATVIYLNRGDISIYNCPINKIIYTVANGYNYFNMIKSKVGQTDHLNLNDLIEYIESNLNWPYDEFKVEHNEIYFIMLDSDGKTVFVC